MQVFGEDSYIPEQDKIKNGMKDQTPYILSDEKLIKDLSEI